MCLQGHANTAVGWACLRGAMAWHVWSYSLQGIFAWLLSAMIGKTRTPPVLGACMFEGLLRAHR